MAEFYDPKLCNCTVQRSKWTSITDTVLSLAYEGKPPEKQKQASFGLQTRSLGFNKIVFSVRSWMNRSFQQATPSFMSMGIYFSRVQFIFDQIRFPGFSCGVQLGPDYSAEPILVHLVHFAISSNKNDSPGMCLAQPS